MYYVLDFNACNKIALYFKNIFMMVSRTFIQRIYAKKFRDIFFVMFLLEIEFSIEIKYTKNVIITLYFNSKETLQHFKIRENRIRSFGV